MLFIGQCAHPRRDARHGQDNELTMSNSCALCQAQTPLSDYAVEAAPSPTVIAICESCEAAIAAPTQHASHWQSLTTTMWSEDIGTQVTAYRILKTLTRESFAKDALDMLYLEDDTRIWADSAPLDAGPALPTRDANGAILSAGDNVTLIKDLPVKGAGFTAKRGTAVRGISLTDNPEHIEGRVNGQRIVIISAFVKKT